MMKILKKVLLYVIYDGKQYIIKVLEQTIVVYHIQQ